MAGSYLSKKSWHPGSSRNRAAKRKAEEEECKKKYLEDESRRKQEAQIRSELFDRQLNNSGLAATKYEIGKIGKLEDEVYDNETEPEPPAKKTKMT